VELLFPALTNQCWTLEKSVNPMEMDKTPMLSIKRSSTIIGADRQGHAPKERKAMNLDHLYPVTI